MQKRLMMTAMLLTATTTNWLGAQEQKPATLPPVVVTEPKPLLEETAVGPNAQPRWTTSGRLTPNTRAYVLPPWKVEFAQWWKADWPRDGKARHRFQEEIEIGLPHRFQLDLYENWQRGRDGEVRHTGAQVELRYALADWGKIPLNPTLYAEWKFNEEEADAIELKLLLTEELAPRWHWGFNATWEQQVGDSRETEWAASQGVTYTLIDDKLSAGLEMVFEHASEKGSRSNPGVEFLIGPSVVWQICPRTRFSVVSLFGATDDSPEFMTIANFSIAFGGGADEKGGPAPISIKSK